jgi:hypothetical protein
MSGISLKIIAVTLSSLITFVLSPIALIEKAANSFSSSKKSIQKFKVSGYSNTLIFQ